MKRILIAAFAGAFLIACNNEKKETKASSDESTTASSSDKKNADELLDLSEGDGVKNAAIAFSKGDLEGMTANYADTILYQWSSGDTLRGKKAVQDYYKGRWKLIDSLNYSEHIVLPVKVGVQQSQYAPNGKWVLLWSFAHVKYKNGKKISFWIHNVKHFNESGKIDYVGQYIDRGKIAAANAGMK